MQIIFIDAVVDPTRPGRSGLSDINWRLGEELAHRGHRISIIGPYHETVDLPVHHPNIHVELVPKSVIERNNIGKHMARSLYLSYVAKKMHFNNAVYHVPDSISAATLSLMGLGNSVVWHGHSNVYHHSQHQHPWDKSMYWAMKAASHFSARQGVHIIALGPSLIPWWRQCGFQTAKIHVIPNAIEITENPLDVPPDWSVPPSWQNNTFRLLYVGRLSAEKGGYQELIDAVDLLNAHGISIGLVFVGDGPLYGELTQYVADKQLRSHITFLGNQPKEAVQMAYVQADMVVLPSIGEMMPRVMLEAWAAGAPFMATNIGAIPDYLIDNQNGFLLQDISTAEMVNRIKEPLLNKELRELVSQQGKASARRLSWTYVTDQFEQLYRWILSGDSVP